MVSEFKSLVNPQRSILPFISKLTGISNQMVAHAPTFEEIAPEVLEILEQHIFVAHNVRFDYGFIKAAFSKLDTRFRSPHLCTVELSRKVFPNLPSYSLGNLCKSLEIPVKDRHRAYGDTLATTKLFKMIWEADAERVIQEIKTDEITSDHFPEGFNFEEIESVPETTGLFTFYGLESQPVYVCRTKNLRNSILSYFKIPLQQQKVQWIHTLTSFTFQEFPSEMSAMLIESKLVLEHQPVRNKAIKLYKNRFGLYLQEDENGYIELKIIEIKQTIECPIIKFNSLNRANKYLSQFYEKINLNEKHKNNFSHKDYNQIIQTSLRNITYPYQNCWIIESKSYDQKSIVYNIQDYELKGYAFINNLQRNDMEDFSEQMQEIVETSDLRRSFLQFIRHKKSSLEIIELNN
jgi:DNA polymerase-3 subunit epsilon